MVGKKTRRKVMSEVNPGNYRLASRLHITVPAALAKEFETIASRLKLTKVAAAREALREWIEKRIEDEMAEGYKAVTAENARIMEEFKYVDAEGWE